MQDRQRIVDRGAPSAYTFAKTPLGEGGRVAAAYTSSSTLSSTSSKRPRDKVLDEVQGVSKQNSR